MRTEIKNNTHRNGSATVVQRNEIRYHQKVLLGNKSFRLNRSCSVKNRFCIQPFLPKSRMQSWLNFSTIFIVNWQPRLVHGRQKVSCRILLVLISFVQNMLVLVSQREFWICLHFYCWCMHVDFQFGMQDSFIFGLFACRLAVLSRVSRVVVRSQPALQQKQLKMEARGKFLPPNRYDLIISCILSYAKTLSCIYECGSYQCISLARNHIYAFN